MRTGQVTAGPAKVDLKTIQVIVEGGEIQVRVLQAGQIEDRRAA